MFNKIKKTFILKTKEYFSPLKKAWFWKYCFPILLILSMYMTYLESINAI